MHHHPCCFTPPLHLQICALTHTPLNPHCMMHRFMPHVPIPLLLSTSLPPAILANPGLGMFTSPAQSAPQHTQQSKEASHTTPTRRKGTFASVHHHPYKRFGAPPLIPFPNSTEQPQALCVVCLQAPSKMRCCEETPPVW